MSLGFLSGDLLSVDQLLDQRLVFGYLVDLSTTYEIRTAVADLDDVDAVRGHSNSGERRTHPLELWIATALLMDEIVCVDGRVIKFSDEVIFVALRR